MTESSNPDQPTYVDPVTGQQLFVDPVTGQLVYPDAANPSPMPAYPNAGLPQYPGYPGMPADPGLLPPTTPDSNPASESPASGFPSSGFPSSGYPSSGYPSSGLPTSGYPSSGYPSSGYPATGYTAPAFPGPYGTGYPMPLVVRTNPLAISSLVLSIVGGTLLICYGLGALAAITGIILGYVARAQIRQRGEAGAGMALAGIIIGWIITGISILAIIVIVLLVTNRIG
jgi:hypothetical protein